MAQRAVSDIVNLSLRNITAERQKETVLKKSLIINKSQLHGEGRNK